MPAVVLGIGAVSLTRLDVSLGGCIRQACGAGRLPLAHAGALQLETMGTVDDTVDDRIADRQISHDVMPASYGDLAGDQQRALVVAVVDDLQQVAPLLGGQRLQRIRVANCADPQSSMISSRVRSMAASIRGSRPSPRAVARSANSRGARL